MHATQLKKKIKALRSHDWDLVLAAKPIKKITKYKDDSSKSFQKGNSFCEVKIAIQFHFSQRFVRDLLETCRRPGRDL
jgi:hypothetical protein